MIIVGRHINGITINPLEYVFDENGNVMEFKDKDEAVEFLKEHGVTEEEMEYLIFKEVDHE